jgi:hypothetical protein
MSTEISDITEQRPCGYPVVYGYLRLASRSAARRKALVSAFICYCWEHELSVGGLFTDYVSPTEPVAIGFTGLLDVLSLAGSYGVVVPTETHLGRGDVAANRKQHIARTGSRLLVMRRRSSKRNQPTEDNQRRAS